MTNTLTQLESMTFTTMKQAYNMAKRGMLTLDQADNQILGAYSVYCGVVPEGERLCYITDTYNAINEAHCGSRQQMADAKERLKDLLK